MINPWLIVAAGAAVFGYLNKSKNKQVAGTASFPDQGGADPVSLAPMVTKTAEHKPLPVVEQQYVQSGKIPSMGDTVKKMPDKPKLTGGVHDNYKLPEQREAEQQRNEVLEAVIEAEQERVDKDNQKKIDKALAGGDEAEITDAIAEIVAEQEQPLYTAPAALVQMSANKARYDTLNVNRQRGAIGGGGSGYAPEYSSMVQGLRDKVAYMRSRR